MMAVEYGSDESNRQRQRRRLRGRSKSLLSQPARICDVIADSVPEGRAGYMLTQGLGNSFCTGKLLSGTVL
jgi:hypothetical protein